MKTKFLLLVILLIFVQKTLQQSIFPQLDTINQYENYYRQLVKSENNKKIEQFNTDQAHSFNLSPNKFLALSNDQFHSIYTTAVKINDQDQSVTKSMFQEQSTLDSNSKGMSIQQKTTFEPSSQCDSVNIDWSIHASSVKDQGACNSCYAHSAIATVETMMHINNGIFYDLSQQHISQCTFKWAPKGYQIFNNQGCLGGWGWKSLHYMKFIGVTNEQNYPYVSGKTGKLNQCNEKTISTKRFKIKDYNANYNKIWPDSQCNILIEKLTEGKTIAVSIWAPKGIQYQFYGSATKDIDIFNICGNYDDVNHELQLVGSTDRFWKLKNSYGIQWGQKGYFYLDKSKGLNCLNVCMDFSYPTDIIPDTA